MTISVERMRWCAARLGGILWMTISTFPLFGGVAKQAVRCRGREFTGRFDDCFNDLIPVMELAAPLVALMLMWPLLRMAHVLWAPAVAGRSLKWQLASQNDDHPHLHIVALGGMCWSIWRAALYPFDALTLPYQAVWLIFAMWFAVGGVLAWRRGKIE